MRYPDDFDDIVVTGSSGSPGTPGVSALCPCMHRLESEVNNGGFHQFFSNSSWRAGPGHADALAKIGAPQTKRLLEKQSQSPFRTAIHRILKTLWVLLPTSTQSEML